MAFPWTNPLNAATHRAFAGSFQANPDAKLPPASPFNPELAGLVSGPSVPNQLAPPPIRVSMPDTARFCGDRFFTCADGTVLDVKLRRIVCRPKDAKPGYWGNPDRMVEPPFSGPGLGTWDDKEIMSGPCSDPLMAQVTPADRAYWDRINKEFAVLSGTISTENAELLADLEAGRITKPANLVVVDESKRRKGQHGRGNGTGREDLV